MMAIQPGVFVQPQFVQPQFVQTQFMQPQVMQPQFMQPQILQPQVIPIPNMQPGLPIQSTIVNPVYEEEKQSDLATREIFHDVSYKVNSALDLPSPPNHAAFILPDAPANDPNIDRQANVFNFLFTEIYCNF